jgi:hypothetical protein
MEIQWTDNDPDTGERRYVTAEKFARLWRFKLRHGRRGEWKPARRVSREMWEALLDGLERRHQRKNRASDEDLAAVRKIIAGYRDPPESDGEIVPPG